MGKGPQKIVRVPSQTLGPWCHPVRPLLSVDLHLSVKQRLNKWGSLFPKDFLCTAFILIYFLFFVDRPPLFVICDPEQRCQCQRGGHASELWRYRLLLLLFRPTASGRQDPGPGRRRIWRRRGLFRRRGRRRRRRRGGGRSTGLEWNPVNQLGVRGLRWDSKERKIAFALWRRLLLLLIRKEIMGVQTVS